MPLANDDIKFTSVYKINRETNECTAIERLTNINDFLISLIINQLEKETNKRKFELKNTSTQIYSFCLNLVSNYSAELIQTDRFKEELKNAAERLLESEISAQQRLRNFENIEIMKGSLITSLIKNNDDSYVVLVKIEHDEFIDDVLYELRRGIPTKNIKYKSCIFHFINNSLHRILIFDSNNTDYWYNTFLELNKVGDDSKFTTNALNVIKKSINCFNNDYPQDCVNLIQIVNSYFTTHSNFLFSDIIEEFENYECFDNDFNIDDVTLKINEKRQSPRYQFENSFEIDRPKIKKQLTQQYRANKKVVIELIPDEANSNTNPCIDSYIVSSKEEDKAFLKIYTDNKLLLTKFNYENEDFSNIISMEASAVAEAAIE